MAPNQMKEHELNMYSDYYGLGGSDHKSRAQGGFAVGDAIGSMITATVFGLTRGIDDLAADGGRKAGTDNLDADSVEDGDKSRHT